MPSLKLYNSKLKFPKSFYTLKDAWRSVIKLDKELAIPYQDKKSVLLEPTNNLDKVL